MLDYSVICFGVILYLKMGRLSTSITLITKQETAVFSLD